ncbi:histidine phosphatase family protein [Luedemannella flava]|uniref:Histidine phosphatase family protein n=1 Tax=Luedemannella flava TaxID=349316 RepID=A0ABN2MK47_9ACTN
MATVLLLRHGRTTANVEGVLAGRRPVSLNDEGRAQAVAVGERLRDLPFAAVVSSPLPRCVQTVAAALPDAVPALEPNLTEVGYGDWEGGQLRELAKEPLWRVVQQHPAAVTFPGERGEAMPAMSARAVAAVRAWDAKVTASHGPDALWLACSHGDVIKAIIADALGLHLDQFQRIVVDPASVTAIRFTPARPFLLRLNDTGADLRVLIPPPRPDEPREDAESDAVVGGGAGRPADDASPVVGG